jgi:Phage terminase, small subunit
VVERYGYALGTAAVAAEVEARAVLGSDFDRFEAAVQRYVLTVDVADHARAMWEAEGRPMRHKFANGMAGVSPYLKAWMLLAAQAMRFGGELGLTPASQKRISGVRGAGRPMGAASAADRKALPPPLLRLADPFAAVVDRARGHAVED